MTDQLSDQKNLILDIQVQLKIQADNCPNPSGKIHLREQADGLNAVLVSLQGYQDLRRVLQQAVAPL